MVSGLSPAGTVSPTGLERLWRSSRSQALSVSAATPKMSRLARQREDIEHASRSSLHRQVLDRIDEAERRRRVARVEIAGDDGTGPAADAGDERDILPAVGPPVTDRLADDP